MTYDEDAPDLATANRIVVKDIQTYLEKNEKLLSSQYLINYLSPELK